MNQVQLQTRNDANRNFEEEKQRSVNTSMMSRYQQQQNLMNNNSRNNKFYNTSFQKMQSIDLDLIDSMNVSQNSLYTPGTQQLIPGLITDRQSQIKNQQKQIEKNPVS